METIVSSQMDIADLLGPMFSGLLLVAMVGAALGVVNTTVISVSERRRELGLLRAIGATRKEVHNLIVGEAALMGLVGGVMGLVAGFGIMVIFVVTYGSNAWGINVDLWAAAGRTVASTLLTAVVGLIGAPLIAAWAAWLPSRSLLRGQPIETLHGRE